MPTAEHVTRVVAAADVNGVDFGFSFNAVVATRDGDDDGANNRTIQGSLRQFIQNANSLSGANTMRFVPAGPTNAAGGGGNWWQINPASTLDTITDTFTVIDGRAYDRADGVTVVNPNSGTLGTGGTVGTDGLALPQVARPELELFDTARINMGLYINAVDVTVRRLSIWAFGNSFNPASNNNANIQIGNVTGAVIEENVIGTPADSFADPVANRTLGPNIRSIGGDNGTIRNNLIGFSESVGIYLSTSADNWLVQGNEIRGNAINHPPLDGIDLPVDSINATIRGNLISANLGAGVDMYQGGGQHTIENNTITNHGAGILEDSGIRLYGVDTTVQKNIITANAGSGVMIVNNISGAPAAPPFDGNLISQNRIFNNGKLGIDLHTVLENNDLGTAPYVTANDGGDGDSGANLGQNFPVITSAVWNGANTVIEGTLNSTAGTTFNIEVFSNTVCNGDTTGTPQAQTNGEGETYRLTINNVTTDGSGNAAFNTNIAADLTGLYMAATAINPATDDTSEFSACVQVAVPATVEFELAAASDQEANGGNIPRLIVTGTLTTDQTIEVNVTGGSAGTPGDFSNTASVTIPAGIYSDAVAATINLSIVDDGLVEPDETIDLQLANPSTGLAIGDANSDATTQNTHTYTILNDDGSATVQMAAAASSVAENAGAAHTVTVQLNTAGALGADVTVQVVDLATGSATQGAGNDYTYTSPTLVTFAAGALNGDTQSVSLTPLNDALVEGSETVNLQLQNATGPATILAGSLDHQVTITDDEAGVIEFQLATSGDVESSGGNIPQLIVNGIFAAAHTIDVTVTGGSAVSGTDFNNIVSVTIPAGSYSGTAAATINLAIIDDSAIEPNETIGFTLANPSGGLGIGDADSNGTTQNTHTYTITDDDSPIVEFSSASGSDTESSGGNIPLLLIRGTLAAPATIEVNPTGGSASGGGVDYSNIALVNIPAGIYDGTLAMAIPINLSVINDSLYENSETIDLALANPSAGLTVADVNGNAGVQFNSVYTILDDENSIVFRLTKIANKTEASIGDIITYQVDVSNTLTNDVPDVRIIDYLPPNFKYVDDSARLNGSALANPTGNRPLVFDIGTVPGLVDGNGNGRADPGEPGYLVLRYQLVVGSGAQPDDYENTAYAVSVCDTCQISNSDSVTVTMNLSPLEGLTTIIGKVFMDHNRNGWQDDGDTGVAGAMVALDNGTYALTDKHGRYHFPSVAAGQRLVKVNLNTLGAGAVATTKEAVVLWITPGLLAKANFGVFYETETVTIGRPGQSGIFLESQILHKPLEVIGGAENLALLINGEMASIPTDNVQLLVENLNEVVEIKGQTPNNQILFKTEPGPRQDEKSWQLKIMDAGGRVIRTLGGKGSLPPVIRWDGRFNKGQTVKGGDIYQYQMAVLHADGSRATSARKLFGINQNTAIFLNLTGEAFIFDSANLSPKAKQVLKETAGVLRKYPQEKVVVEGHTDSKGTEAYNIDLSRRRAESALRYLVNEEGLPRDRFVLRWYGESKPMASNEYDETRALNRRIEIKGQVDDVKRSKLYDQYRAKPSVKINGKRVKVDSNGRFALEVADQSVKQLNIDVANGRGQSYKTTIKVPSIEILNSEEKVLLRYGSKGQDYQVGKLSEARTAGDETPPISYELRGKTEPGNTLEIDGKAIAVNADGSFATSLALHRGNNPYGLVVRNPAGISRIVNLMASVNDRDKDGKLHVATGPAPNLLVNLPPKGIALNSHHLTVTGATDVDNRIFINEEPVKVEINGYFSTIVNLPKGKSVLTVKAVNPEGHSSMIAREFEVRDTRLFFLAIADGKVEGLMGDGFIAGAGMDEDTEYKTDGRLAFYLKGVIKGKYLITAAMDTGNKEFDKLFEDLDDRDNNRLLTNLDPNRIYPVYGDSSTVVYDTDSQGKLYLALDSDALHLLLGNYAIALNDTELAAYQRTLFGARIGYQSVSKTKYGAPTTKAAAFGAKVDQVPVTDELLATGGSLYYLSRRDVIEGSEQVTLVIRDQNTGLVLAEQPQEQNVDYSIIYQAGHILFKRPINTYSEGEEIIDQGLLPGNRVFIRVNYEAKDDMFENTAAGGRVRQQIGDHVAVGGTYINDELDAGEYELQGVDTEIRLGQNTRLTAEYARSSGTGTLTFVSTDGGLNYSASAPDADRKGDAWKVAAEIDIGEWFDSPGRYQIGGYYRRLEPGFFSSNRFLEEGTDNSGLNMSLAFSQWDKIRGRFDRVETDGTSLRNETRQDIGTFQWVHDHGWWGLTGEYQYRDSEDDTAGETDTTHYAAARLTVKPIEPLTVEAEHQQTITGDTNNQTTVGAKYQVHPSLALEASGKTGTEGQAAWGGAVFTLGDHRIYLTERLVKDRAGQTRATVLGSESALGDSGKVYSEYQWEHTEKGSLKKSVLGAQRQWDVAEGFKLNLSGQYVSNDSNSDDGSQLAIAGGFSYAHPSGFKFTTREEVRRDTGARELTQFLTSNDLEYKINSDLTSLGWFRWSKSYNDDLDETEASFTELSIGLAYRPIAWDRFNALAKYTLLKQDGPEGLGQGVIGEPMTQVAAVDWSLDITPWMEWAQKVAFRSFSEDIDDMPTQTSNSFLSVSRLNFNFWQDFWLGTEYRMLLQQEADDNRQGWATELMWEPLDHIRLGVGYNFTDFSDNEFSDNDYSSHGLYFRFQGNY